MHDNHHLQSTVAYQNTVQTVLSRRATALLRLTVGGFATKCTRNTFTYSCKCAHITGTAVHEHVAGTMIFGAIHVPVPVVLYGYYV